MLHWAAASLPPTPPTAAPDSHPAGGFFFGEGGEGKWMDTGIEGRNALARVVGDEAGRALLARILRRVLEMQEAAREGAAPRGRGGQYGPSPLDGESREVRRESL